MKGINPSGCKGSCLDYLELSSTGYLNWYNSRMAPHLAIHLLLPGQALSDDTVSKFRSLNWETTNNSKKPHRFIGSYWIILCRFSELGQLGLTNKGRSKILQPKSDTPLQDVLRNICHTTSPSTCQILNTFINSFLLPWLSQAYILLALFLSWLVFIKRLILLCSFCLFCEFQCLVWMILCILLFTLVVRCGNTPCANKSSGVYVQGLYPERKTRRSVSGSIREKSILTEM